MISNRASVKLPAIWTLQTEYFSAKSFSGKLALKWSKLPRLILLLTFMCEVSFLEARSREPVHNQGGGYRLPLFGASCLGQRSVRDECLKANVCADVQTKQKIERWRVDWNEPRLHRSLGQLILAKLAQRQIQVRP